jgi:protein-S-isoprenylcysteine O-methyltransferase Ste14
MTGPRAWLTGAILFAVCVVLQGIGAVRYASRMPHDLVGIGLYSVTTVLFTLAAIGFYLKWRTETRQEE